MNNDKQQAKAAAQFARRWQGRGYEKGESQVFWTELLTDVFGIGQDGTPLSSFIKFEQQAHLDHTSFIDAMIPSTHVMIEQKSLGRDLRKPIRQSDGTELTPFRQALRYSAALPYSQRPRWIVTCNFEAFDVYDMEDPGGEPERILLKDLSREYYRLQLLVETENLHLQKELEVSMKAGELVGRLYDAFIKQYDTTDPMSLRYLNILCVRLVFCLYAEDAGIFGRRDQFHDYMAHYPTEDMRAALVRLFEVLNTPMDRRSRYLKPDLAAFPYTNGGLFAEEIDIPQFTDEIRALLLLHASLDFDWSQISPTIFGGVFESTLNPETRRKGGMHYTSIENIHKAIDPLFLDDLRAELKTIMREREVRRRCRLLRQYQERLAQLRFFDPACGSGNFLTETYLSLRRLENRVMQALYSEEPLDAFTNPIRVSIHQFYGIEINDFAVTVATTALWISEAQTMAETERIISHDIDFLPLKSYANIHEGNSLTMDWPSVFVRENPCPSAPSAPLYIIGNPPFVGYSLQSREQKADILAIYTDEKGKPYKTAGKVDYVAAWFFKAAQFMHGLSATGREVRAALVATNSITQGEQVAAVWRPLYDRFNVGIDFAHRTFRWDSEASIKAHVHCVVVGFSCGQHASALTIYDDGKATTATNINPYLIDAPNVFIESRAKAICDVPAMIYGAKPTDGGHLLLTEEEKDVLLKSEPQAAPFIKQLTGSQEFINGKKRYCLWLVGASPAAIKKCPQVLKRVEAVRAFRLASSKEATRKKADQPTLFDEPRCSENNFIIVPSVSSERREYVPMGFMDKSVIVSNLALFIPSATLFHFGILESSVHMAWMRAVCGRLEMRYRYSKDVVYNNFVWPEPTEAQRLRIEATAQAILDARAAQPDCTLADLYDPVLMPPELRRAHRDNDQAVIAAYGWQRDTTEQDIVARLFALYGQQQCP